MNLIAQIWDSHILTHSGPLHEQLTKELSIYLKAPHVSLYVNGHQALEAAIRSFNFASGSEVITTPYTFISTTHAITRNGLKPVFCDISPEDYNIDVSQIEGLITEKTCAIIPVHVYGTPCNVTKIEDLAERYGLKVIYDAAHAFGVEVNGRPITSYGDASMLSFHATKVFNTIEGGAVVSPHASVIDYVNKYRRFGIEIKDTEDYVDIGTNAKMNEFQAAMGLLNLKYIDAGIAHRKRVAETYDSCFSEWPGVRILPKCTYTRANYAYYPIVLDDEFPVSRDELFSRLADSGIYTRKYFSPLVTDYTCYSDLYDSNETPVAKRVSEHVLTLPMYDTLDVNVAKHIAEIVTDVIRN